ncbi:RNA-directed DNA polymerase, eukaryota, reverse transcriptase zinc-binding domain protein, partial [Tanacetum coccineum]
MGPICLHRVLVEFNVKKGFKEEIVIQYKSKENIVKGTKNVVVEYQWKLVICSNCMVFRHSKSKCSKLDKNNVEKDNNVDIKDESSGNSKEDEGFVEVRAAAAFTANPLWVVNTRLQVENSVVGAPCGVMDQMAYVCGEANKLLAMVCQKNIYVFYITVIRDLSPPLVLPVTLCSDLSQLNGLLPKSLYIDCKIECHGNASPTMVAAAQRHQELQSMEALS